MEPVLPLFPEGSLSESVTTTVWVGVFVMCALNLRLGWTCSGLVVPGYVVPLLIVKPCSALVIFLEGILTYALVWFFGQRCSRWGLWANVFGRDRFFAIVLASIGVRVALDGYLLPAFSRHAMASWMVEYDLVNNLHSFGLIIVSLVANQFWKPGLMRGLAPLAVSVGTTYFLVRFVLMRLTNFTMGSFEYMYEDIAGSVLASPKAYIVLVITSYIASRLNLRYSWDFHGILIPSLIAIQWYEPLKVLTSFVEAGVVYTASSLILRLRVFRESTVEGARKILLFFSVSFAYRMLLGHAFGGFQLRLDVVDYFGLGYLLPCLLALKMHDKGAPLRIVRVTLQTSLVGVAAASAVGFSVAVVAQTWRATGLSSSAPATLGSIEAPGSLADKLRADKVTFYQRRIGGSSREPLETEIDAFTAGLRGLRAAGRGGSPAILDAIVRDFSDAGYEISWREGRYYYLSERPPGNGWGAYVVDSRAANDLLVEVPAPLDEWATMECGAFLLSFFGGRALAVATAPLSTGEDVGPRVLAAGRTHFDAFHRVFAGGEVLQVRGYGAASLKALYGIRVPRGTMEPTDVPSSLWVKSRLPPSLSLSALKGLLDGIRVEWRSPRTKNVQRARTSSGFVELFLTRGDRKRLLARWLLGVGGVPVSEAGLPEDGLGRGVRFREWISGLQASMGQRGAGSYVSPTPEELLYLDEEVLSPLAKLAREFVDGRDSRDETVRELRTIHGAARAVRYEVVWHQDDDGGEFLVLREAAEGAARRHWGTYVFRLGAGQPFAVEVPHPIYEENTLELGVDLFERLDAACLFVSGSHPKCNVDGSADVVAFSNRASVFNLANQVVLRDAGQVPFAVVQARALGYRQGIGLPDADALVAFGDSSTTEATLGALGRRVVATLREDGLAVRFVDGGPDTFGYEVHGSAQALYLSHTRDKEFVAVWFAPSVRSVYGRDLETALENPQLAALGIETAAGDLESEVLGGPTATAAAVPRELGWLLRHYSHTSDINGLHSALRLWPQLSFRRALAKGSKRHFLLVRDEVGRLLPIVASLGLRRWGRDTPEETVLPRPVTAADLERFVRSGASLLRWEP
jgi:hypothetical protein